MSAISKNPCSDMNCCTSDKLDNYLQKISIFLNFEKPICIHRSIKIERLDI